MKKIKKIYLAISLIMIMSLAVGCMKANQSEPADVSKEENTKDHQEEKEQEEQEDTDEKTDIDDASNTPEGNLKLYYIDKEKDEITYKWVQIETIDPTYILDALIAEGVLSNQCTMLSFDDSKRMEGYIQIDMDHYFGEQLRQNGTRGEEQFMACFVNTFLDAYDCKGIKITEEGNTLESGHVSYENYISKMIME